MNAKCSDDNMCNRVYNNYSMDYSPHIVEDMVLYVDVWQNIFLKLNKLNKYDKLSLFNFNKGIYEI